MKPSLKWLLVVVLVGAAVAYAFQRHISGAWFAFGVHPDVLRLVEQSLDDQKELARARPALAERYHRRFEEIQSTLNHLRVLQHNRDAIVRRYEIALLVLFGGALVVTAGLTLHSMRRNEARLGRLQAALTALSLGTTDIVTGERRRDAIGRIAAMVEETARVMGRDRRRLASLRNLASWQEAGRRLAHEMRTPLTAARLELDRLGGAIRDGGDEIRERTLARVAGVEQELRRLEEFARRFSSFARLPVARPEPHELGALLEDFHDVYRGAWPNLELVVDAPDDAVRVLVDPPLLRQVIVNLCENASKAVAGGQGRVIVETVPDDRSVALYVTDDGPGVPAEMRERVFEPYASSRPVGDGAGLGLAVSRKIMLDHGGDLELHATSRQGTSFRLLLRREEG